MMFVVFGWVPYNLKIPQGGYTFFNGRILKMDIPGFFQQILWPIYIGEVLSPQGPTIAVKVS